MKSGNLNNLILMPVSLNTAYISKCVFANIHQICEINYKLKVECGHSRGVNFVARHSLKRVKHLEPLNVGTPRESILLPDILAKRSKHIRNVECWHSQGVNFVTRHLQKTCKTQQIAWRCLVSSGSHLLGECAATKVSAHLR